MIVRTVAVSDPLARANVVDALAGPGAPVGVTACTVDGDRIIASFDSERTSPEFIDDLIAVAMAFVPARHAPIADAAMAARLAARGLRDPELDVHRILETHLP
jgi:hypothetical protein